MRHELDPDLARGQRVEDGIGIPEHRAASYERTQRVEVPAGPEDGPVAFDLVYHGRCDDDGESYTSTWRVWVHKHPSAHEAESWASALGQSKVRALGGSYSVRPVVRADV